MDPRPTITTALARLVPGQGHRARPRCYRPLVAGPAVLRRFGQAPVWSVEVDSDELLRPRPPSRDEDVAAFAGRGVARRIGAALAGPLDASHPGGGLGAASRTARRLRIDFYGWALMYQPPGMQGKAVVDADERFADLPAVFELPLELIDRAEFLESRGFRTRPLVIPTRPEDFVAGPDGRLRNRFFPAAAFRPPRNIDRLL